MLEEFFISLILTYILLKISLPFFRKYFEDKPNQRSLHKKTSLRAGGISFVLVGVLMTFAKGYLLPLMSFPLAIVGMIDDKINLKSWIRYLIQLITVLFIMTSNGQFPNLNNIFLFIFILLLGTGIINFVNFMDGSDGLIALSLSIYLIFYSIFINHDLIPIAGSLFGFLILNWSPATIFMGDVGSTFLGSILFGTALETNSILSLLTTLLITLPILGDALTCVLRRFINGQNIFSAHKLHLYQRLCEAGWSHQSVAILYSFSVLILALSNFLGGILLLFFSSIIVFSMGIWLDQTKAIKFNKASI